MKKTNTFRILTIILSVLLLSFLAACGNSESGSDQQGGDEALSAWDKIKEDGTIVVGTSGTLYGTSYYEKESNKLTGYDVEVVREVARRLDLDVKFEEMGLDSMLPSLQSGKIDIAANDIEVTKKRKEKFQFSNPYKYSYGTAIVRADDHSGIESLEDLEGKKAGGAATSVFSQIVRKFDGEVVTYGNATNDAYLRDVALGRTDVILNDYYLQKQALRALPEYDLVMHPDLKYKPSNTAIIMKKGNDELQKALNQALKEMDQDGTLTNLSKEFHNGEDASKKPDSDIREIELNDKNE